MKQEATDYYSLVQKLYEEHVKRLPQLQESIKRCTDLKELVDYAFAMNRASKFLDDMRKTCDATEMLCERLACLIWVAAEMTGPIRTEHCSATPNIKMIATIPKRSTHPAEFEALMTFLGIPKNLIDEEQGEVVRAHWPGLVSYLSRLMSEGKPLPPGIDPQKTYPEYHLTLRPKKGVGEAIS